MSGVGRNDTGRSGPDTVPPFWMPDECGAERIDQRVREISRANWPWAFWLTKRELNDGTRAGQIVEDAAVEVSIRLRSEPEVGRNLNGYFRTTIVRMLKTIAVRDGRIAYEGGTYDLQANHGPQAADWIRIFENRIILETLIPYMSHPVRQILYWRRLDYSWKHIAKQLSLTEKQAKLRFYYGAHQAYEELQRVQATRARERDQRNVDERSR